jgi:N-dimethylarginine dimethylaminohydrolase
MLDRMDPGRAGEQHDALVEVYASAGVKVHLVSPPESLSAPPNLMYVADLMFTTSEGVILGRPASSVRAGEERLVGRRLADLGVPILKTIRGQGTFEGADAALLAPGKALVARGLRTNRAGAAQVAAVLAEQGIQTVEVDLPQGTMHLMGQVRFLDANRALGWPGRVGKDVREALDRSGFEILFMPDEEELHSGMALNLVTLGPGHVVMPAGNPKSQAFLEGQNVRCDTVRIDELAKGAGGIACMTGVLEREPAC